MADTKDSHKVTTIKDPYDSKFYSVDSGDVEIGITGRLRVSYKGQAPEKKYLVERKFPLNTQVQISAVDILNGIVIEENGYFYDQSDVTNLGYWSWKKEAELWPYDSLPD